MRYETCAPGARTTAKSTIKADWFATAHRECARLRHCGSAVNANFNGALFKESRAFTQEQVTHMKKLSIACLLAATPMLAWGNIIPTGTTITGVGEFV